MGISTEVGKSKEQKSMTRIVSLIPSATEIIHVLGMGQYQVGRSHECDFPSSVASLPVCTAPNFPVSGSSGEIDASVKEMLRRAVSVYDVFEDTLDQLQPTHILTQSQCDVCAVSLKDVESAVARHVSSQPNIVSLEPNGLDDVWNDILRVADQLDIRVKGGEVVDALKQRLLPITETLEGVAQRPTVSCIEWLEPLMGAGNWVPELVQMAGGTDLFGQAGKHSGCMQWDELRESDPEILVLFPCGFDMKRTRAELFWLTDRADWTALTAVRSRRVDLADGNQYFNRPGPRLVESLRILAEIIHPDHFDPSLEGEAWEQIS